MQRGINYCSCYEYARLIKENLIRKIQSFGRAYDMVRGEIDFITLATESVKLCHLVVIDEADRLTINSLEQVRDIYDEYKFGLVLIGMPGIEKRLSRYPQLYSRIGFCHEYEKLGQDEMRFIMNQLWDDLGLNVNQNKFSDVEAVNSFIRIIDGNFRLIYRMFSQISRILKINNLDSITKDVVDAARECLVIGADA